MANANIDALYVGSLRIEISHFFPSNFTFYKWCVTNVAHCIWIWSQIDQNHTIVYTFDMEDFCLRREKNSYVRVKKSRKEN